jgi:hypothetical protein
MMDGISAKPLTLTRDLNESLKPHLTYLILHTKLCCQKDFHDLAWHVENEPALSALKFIQ